MAVWSQLTLFVKLGQLFLFSSSSSIAPFPKRRLDMNAKIITFSSRGDMTLLEYNPATADMDEVNKLISEYEERTGAQPFDMETG